MEVENLLFVVEFMVFLSGPFSTSMLVPGSVSRYKGPVDYDG